MTKSLINPNAFFVAVASDVVVLPDVLSPFDVSAALASSAPFDVEVAPVFVPLLGVS